MKNLFQEKQREESFHIINEEDMVIRKKMNWRTIPILGVTNEHKERTKANKLNK